MLPLDNWGTPWAVTRPTLIAIGRIMRGDFAPEMVARLADLEPQAMQPLAFVGGESGDEAGGPVAVLALKGVITPEPSLLSMLMGASPGGLKGFRSQLAQAAASEQVKSILIDVDSPGGSTALLPETAADIREARKSKPVVAVANNMAASAAYWLASQADELVATPSALVGSVGTFAVHEDWSAFNEKLGVEPTFVSAGEHKLDMSEAGPLSEDGRAQMQAVVDHMQGLFEADIAKGRGIRAETVRASYGQGAILTAADAQKAGMVDRVESIEQAAGRMVRGRVSRRSRVTAEAPALQPAALAEENGPVVDKPEPKVESTEEERARIAAVVGGKPIHVLGGRTE